MRKIGFVIPWYGKKIPGGAEMELRGITEHLHTAGIEIEILTTCVKEFSSDWNENYYKEGIEKIDGIDVRRFKVRKRDANAFNAINYKLLNNYTITENEEKTFIDEMVNSTDLNTYISKNKNDYDLFVFIPYMFGTTYFGVAACPEKSVLIPCFHNESYFYMNIFKNMYSKVLGIVYNAQPEYELTNKYYDMHNTLQIIMGIGMDTDIVGESQRFRNKYNIDQPFVLYAGRKDSGKNVDTLVTFFIEYKKRNQNDCKLVLIGGGQIGIPEKMKNEILDLGFVDMQDKYDAYASSTCLCQPSKNESFSLVLMESWLCNRPVIVSEECDVTKNFVLESQGGLYYNSYFEFEACINYYLKHPDTSSIMGQQGRQYVIESFDWNNITNKYIQFFNECINLGKKNK